MKVRRLGILTVLFLSLCCILFGCSKKEGTVTYGEMNMEDQPYWNIGRHLVAKGENGYYYLRVDGPLDTVICYMDAATGNSTVLCSNAECRHDGKNCPAYMSGQEYLTSWIYYHNNKLYLIYNDTASGFCYLEELAASGGPRSRLFEIGENPSEHGYDLTFHGDSVYICAATAGLGFEESTVSIRHRSLDGKVDETVYSHTGRGPAFRALKSYGDKLYFLVQDWEMEREGNGAKVTIKRKGMYVYDYADQKVSQLSEEAVCDYAIDVKEKVLYYYVYESGLYKKDLVAGDTKKIYDYEVGQSEMCNVSCDGNYVYLDNGKYATEVVFVQPKAYQTYVMDKDGTILNKISSGWASAYFGDETYLFSNDPGKVGYPLRYIKKSEIKSAKEWHYIDSGDYKDAMTIHPTEAVKQ